MSKKEKKEALNNSTIYDRLFDVKSLADIKQLKKDLNSRLRMKARNSKKKHNKSKNSE